MTESDGVGAASSRIKALMITQELPFPALSGGLVVSMNLAKILSSKFELEVICLRGDASKIGPFAAEAGIPAERVEVLELPLKNRNMKNFLLSLLRGVPITVYRARNASAQRLIAAHAQDASYILADGYTTWQFVPKAKASKALLHTHNAEYVIWKRFAAISAPNLVLKLTAYWEAYRTWRYEKKIYARAKTTIFLSAEDRAHFPAINSHVFPPLPDPEWAAARLEINEQVEPAFLFVGTLSWAPNEDGLRWFIEEVWNSIVSEHPGAQLEIVGRGASGHLKSLLRTTPNARLDESAPPTSGLLRDDVIFLAPLRIGSGVKIKVLNAAAAGFPVVTTSVGAEGLPLVNGTEICVADDADGFKSAIQSLLRDYRLRKSISVNAKRKINDWIESSRKEIVDAIEGTFVGS